MRERYYTIYRKLIDEKQVINLKVSKAEVGRIMSSWTAVYPDWDIRAEQV